MGLRDWFHKRGQLSQLSIEVQELIAERDELERKCQQLEQQCENVSGRLTLEQYRREDVLVQVDCLSHLFQRFCAQPPNPEQLYNQAAPYLDPDGFCIYAAVTNITGICIHDYFHYEDNCGMFEAMSYPAKTHYLEAAHFGAVTWKIVPGTSYEEANLGKVDTTTPEYRAFREAICKDALGRMGLGHLLKTKEKEVKEVGHER